MRSEKIEKKIVFLYEILLESERIKIIIRIIPISSFIHSRIDVFVFVMHRVYEEYSIIATAM
ncbi:hypothetical protein TUM12150_11980 [Morganella morganii]|nr:hypothetical protein TUM12150_11980 [Morganella morganii]